MANNGLFLILSICNFAIQIEKRENKIEILY